MTTIFSRSESCQELIPQLYTSAIPVLLTPLMTATSGVTPSRVYQYQTEPPLVLVFYNGRGFGLNGTDWSWYADIKRVSDEIITVNNGNVSFSVDENNDPVFRYSWGYDDNAATGRYQAQIHGVLNADGRRILFEPYDYYVRPRV